MTHFGLKRYLALWERLREYPYDCTIVVSFLGGVEISKWKQKTAKFSKLGTFKIIYNKNLVLGSHMKPTSSYSLVLIINVSFSTFRQSALIQKSQFFSKNCLEIAKNQWF